MAYVILAHLAYLLTSILGFNVIRSNYTFSVLISLIEFMVNIRFFLLKSSVFLHALMEILILHFCVIINAIFLLIEAKLLFYLEVLKFQIYVDYGLLLVDIASIKVELEKLQSDISRYKSILEKVKELSKFTKLLSNEIGNMISIFSAFYKVVKILICKFKSICKSCNNLNGISCCLTQETKESGSSNVCISLENIIITWKEISDNKVTASIMKINLSDITKFQKGVNSIQKLLDKADQKVSKEIMSTIGQLDVLESMNLLKMYELITKIQVKYLDILIRGYLLLCTIQFYEETKPLICKLIDSLKFKCSDCHGFLGQCSEVENYIKIVSSSINECIKKLATFCNNCKGCIFRKQLIQVHIKLIGIIFRLKFYVDLMAMEILIFKMIILTLVQMSVSSVHLDFLMSQIAKNITKVDEAIPRLMFVNVWLRAFYVIQLQNTMTIFALSSRLKFSQSIHNDYYVLLLNLDLINRLIWVIECYIHHLIVFKHVSTNLNSLMTYIGDQFKIITEIKNAVKAMETITNKLKSINNSITQLNDIQSGMNILNWKESGKSIRHEIKSVSEDIGEINSHITEINKNRDEIIKSWATLISLENFMKGLISYVKEEIEKTNKERQVALGIGNKYYGGVILSVMEPCNKQLKFILGYLVVMSADMRNLINIVQNAILIIYVKMGWLKGLTTKLQTYITNINKGVVDVECAIEGVARNFIKCTIKSLSTHLIISNSISTIIRDGEVDNQVVGVYSVLSVNQYKDLVNRMLEFWTFCDESVELFKYIRFCLCSLNFESEYRDERPSTFDYPLPSIKTRDINPVSELMRHTMAENVGNHMCLCLVIKYHLRPTLLKCILFLRNEELGTLDTISRKFDNYNSLVGIKADLWKLCELTLNIIYELTSLLRNRYNFVWIRSSYPAEIKCFCTDTNTIDYHYILTISLYLSSLIENIWSMDTESLRMTIECLSTLYSQLESYDLSSVNDTKKLRCNSIYTLVVDKQCKDKGTCQCKESGKCCCCSIIVNVLMIYISLCIQCKLCNAICNNKKKACDKVKEFCNIEKCECKCPKGKNGLCCLLNLALSKNGDCQKLEKKLEECCTSCTQQNGCCKTLLEKVKDGKCKLLLLGCCCNDAKCGCDSSSDGPLKGWCLMFDNPYSDKSVALVVFCKCKEPKGCCCLYNLVEKFKEKLSKICEKNGCGCEELKSVCEKLCCKDCTDCVCKTLPDLFKKICEDGECLCKQIEKIKDCITKCAKDKCQCCKDKEGCCRCQCCKLVGMSIKILTRACRANVLEAYKRVVMELISCSKNKEDVIRTIVEGINRTTLDNIYLVKNSCSSYIHLNNVNNIGNIGVTNVETRNWGYDTKYEHDVSTDEGFIRGDGYPNLIDPRYTFSHLPIFA